MHERGVALVSVLWAMALLSLLASTLIATVRSDARSTRRDLARFRAEAVAEAGIGLAILELTGPDGEWQTDGSVHTVAFDGVSVEVSAMAESGKVDLNVAPPDLLEGLLRVQGLSPGDADMLTREIMEKRGANDPRARFESLGDLMSLPEMTRDLYQRIVPDATLYSGLADVDTNSAPREVLLARPHQVASDVDAILAERLAERGAPNRARSKDPSGIIGRVFSISAVARLDDGTVGRRTRVVRLTGDGHNPVIVLGAE